MCTVETLAHSNGVATIVNSRAIPQKLKTELPHNLAIPLLGKYPKEQKARSQKDIYISVFIAALFLRVKRWKQLKLG